MAHIQGEKEVGGKEEDTCHKLPTLDVTPCHLLYFALVHPCHLLIDGHFMVAMADSQCSTYLLIINSVILIMSTLK